MGRRGASFQCSPFQLQLSLNCESVPSCFRTHCAVKFQMLLPPLLLTLSEEVRFSVMLHLLVIWINISAVSSAVWEHNAPVWLGTKTRRSNNNGLLSAHARLVVLWFAESFSILWVSVIISFGYLPAVSSRLLPITLACLWSTCRSCQRATETGRRGSSLSLTRVFEPGDWPTADRRGGVAHNSK